MREYKTNETYTTSQGERWEVFLYCKCWLILILKIGDIGEDWRGSELDIMSKITAQKPVSNQSNDATRKVS